MSVVVPTWNGAAYLGETLASARGQTFGDFELLVVDDGSTDATLAIAEAAGDPRTTVHRNPRRLGIPGNWNRCLELARGRYVKFLFQDDVLHPDAVARLVAALDSAPGAALAFGRREIRHEGADRGALPLDDADLRTYGEAQARFYASFDGPLAGADLVARALAERRDLTINVIGEPSFVLVDREAARSTGGFDARLFQLVDWELWLRVARAGAIVFVDASLGVFRLHAAGQSAANARSLRLPRDFVRVLRSIDRHYGPLLPDEARRRLRAEIGRYRRHLLGEALRRLLPRGRGRRT